MPEIGLTMPDIRKVIKNPDEKNKLTVAAQRKVRCKPSGKRVTYGVEMLCRLISGGKIFPPGAYIPRLEQRDSLMRVLTEQVFVLSHEFALECDRLGIPISVDFNVPKAGLVGEVLGRMNLTLNNEPLSITRMGIELVENIPPSILVEAEPILAAYQSLGLSLSLDDVGSSQRPIARSREVGLPVQAIKVDGSILEFENDEPNDDERRWLRSFTVSLVTFCKEMSNGQSNPLRLLFERVESETVLQLLIDAGAEDFQGYLFGKPCSPEEMLGILKAEYHK